MSLEENVAHPPGTNTVSFHRKQFLAERIGWVAMAALVAWTLLGGFGDGWLSQRTTANEAQTLQAEYQRFARRESPVDLVVRLHRQLNDGRLVLHLSREFIDEVKLERVTPKYRAMAADGDGLSMEFDIEPETRECAIAIEYKPRGIGPLHGAISAPGYSSVAFDQFVYP